MSEGTIGEAIRELEESVLPAAFQETLRKKETEAAEWAEHLDSVVTILQPTLKAAGINSLVGFRLLDLFRDLIWIQHSVLRGAYHSAIRDLRYALESMVQGFVVDSELPGAPMGKKFELVADLGTRSFSKVLARAKTAESSAIQVLYNDLSKYVHPTKEELERVLIRGRVDIRFAFGLDQEVFDVTRELTRRTVDVLLYLVCLRFPEAREAFREEPHAMDSLRQLQQAMTLSALSSSAPLT